VIGISGKKNNRSIIARIDFWFMLDKKGRVYELCNIIDPSGRPL
jgi:hypothetical protein